MYQRQDFNFPKFRKILEHNYIEFTNSANFKCLIFYNLLF